MRASRLFIIAPPAWLALVGVVLAPASAAAHETAAPRYSLSIRGGETTQPEHNLLRTSADAHQGNTSLPDRLTIRAGSTVIGTEKGEGGIGLSQVPQVGDTVIFESPLGTTIDSIVYDGLPSMDPTVCAGSVNFSGQRSAGETVSGDFYTEFAVPNPYYVEYQDKGFGQAQVTSLAGQSFGGSFLTALQPGETVAANESIETPLGNGAIFTYESENVRPVGACPAPPPPPPPPPAPIVPPLGATLAKLLSATIHGLLKHGWSDKVTVNQAGTVTQDLYLENGALPAFASRKRHHTPPPALLLARGAVVAHAAGTVSVALKLTGRGRSRLRHAHSAHVVLITTVHAVTGAKITLPRRRFTLHR